MHIQKVLSGVSDAFGTNPSFRTGSARFSSSIRPADATHLRNTVRNSFFLIMKSVTFVQMVMTVRGSDRFQTDSAIRQARYLPGW